MSSEKTYVFHCVICGTKFHVTRCDARTCSKICRVVLSQLSRYGKNIGVEEIAPEDKKEVEKKLEGVKTTGAEPTEEKKETIASRLLGSKKVVPSNPMPTPEPVESEPTENKKKK